MNSLAIQNIDFYGEANIWKIDKRDTAIRKVDVMLTMIWLITYWLISWSA